MKQSEGRVSVIIPTFNRSAVIKRAIMSVLSQSYTNLELIIVDDGSTDQTEELVLGFGDPRIRYVKMEERGGAQRARVAGMKVATGDYIAFLDSDDELTAGSIASRVKSLQSSGFRNALVYGDMEVNYGSRQVISYSPRFLGMAYSYMTKELRFCPFITIMVTRESMIEAIPRLALDLPSWQDDDFCLAVGKITPVVYCGEIVAACHASEDAITKSDRRILLGCKMMVAKYREEIISNHGYLCLFFWQFRKLFLYVIYLQSIVDPNKVLFIKLLGAVRSTLKRALYRYFSNV